MNTLTGAERRKSIRVVGYDEAPSIAVAKKGESPRDFQLAFITWLKRRGLYEGSTTEHACLRAASRKARQFKKKQV